MVANCGDFDFYGAGGTNGLLLGTTSKTAPANYRVRTQPLAGLPSGRTQEFMTFVSNATRVGTALPTVPNLTLQVCVELTGAATCAPPAATTIGLSQGTGIVLPLLNPNSGLVFKVDCSVTATASRTSLACGNFPTPAI